jgi:hypothetical protein
MAAEIQDMLHSRMLMIRFHPSTSTLQRGKWLDDQNRQDQSYMVHSQPSIRSHPSNDREVDSIVS